MTPYHLALAATLIAGSMLFAVSGYAQGTPEQREACQDDAFRLCGQFIPDIDSTKACMVKNISRLTPRCKAVFDAARRKK